MMLVPRRNFDLFDDLFDDNFFNKKEKNLMKTDIKEKKDKYIIEMDLPGFEKENIKLELNNGYLTISGKQENKIDEEEEKYVHKERFYGECTRSFYVGDNIKEDKILLMGDSTGCNIITGINYLNKDDFKIEKEVLFYPVISMDYEKANYESMIKNKDFNLGILTKLRAYYESINYKDDKLLKPLELKDYRDRKSVV